MPLRPKKFLFLVIVLVFLGEYIEDGFSGLCIRVLVASHEGSVNLFRSKYLEPLDRILIVVLVSRAVKPCPAAVIQKLKNALSFAIREK